MYTKAAVVNINTRDCVSLALYMYIIQYIRSEWWNS